MFEEEGKINSILTNCPAFFFGILANEVRKEIPKKKNVAW